MTDEATPAPASDVVTVKTVEHGEASALPVLQWQWRRWLTLLSTIGALALLWLIVDRMTTAHVMERLSAIPGVITALKWIALSLIGIVGWNVFIFVAGATGAECVQMVMAFRSTKRETTTTAPPPAQVSTNARGTTTVDSPTPAAAAPDKGPADFRLPPSERVMP